MDELIAALRRTEEKSVFIKTDDGHGWFDSQEQPINPDGPEAADALARLRGALEPFANVARQIRATGADNRWLEQILFFMGDDNDPSKWSLSGRAFDQALEALTTDTTKIERDK